MIIKTDDKNYFDIAAAIREKNETDEVYKPSEMALAIANIESGGIPCTLTVTTAEGALVEATLGSKKVSATAGTDGTAILILEKEGLWTISATLDGETKSTEILVEHSIEESLTFFPEEPSAYNQLALITSSQTWTAPENGWFQIEDFGASGSGGNGYYRYSVYLQSNSGGGGGGGGYAASRIKMSKGDTAEINIGDVGAVTSVLINSSLETYFPLYVTSGANGGSYVVGSSGSNSGGAGGVASGGNYANNNGGNGGNGISQQGSVASGGAGGAAGYTGGNVGGAGGKGDSSHNAGEAGKAGFIKIYRGNTNANPNANIDGYTRLNCIKATGTQYIDTGCSPSDNTKVVINLTPLVSGMAENAVFGSTWAANGFFLMFYQNMLRWHSKGASVDISAFNTTGENEIVCTPTKITVNGTEYGLSGSQTDSTTAITLFCAGGYSAAKYGIYKLHSCQIYNGNELLKDYVPVLDSSGVPCLYDKLNKALVYNNGSGMFDYE